MPVSMFTRWTGGLRGRKLAFRDQHFAPGMAPRPIAARGAISSTSTPRWSRPRSDRAWRRYSV